MTEAVLEGETSHVVHFDVEGKFIADLARTRVSEGAWDRALHLLTDSMSGMTHEVAISILKGEGDLTGWASDKKGVGYKKLRPDGALAKKMHKRLEYLYGSTFYWDDTYWRPYARVTGWNKEDHDFAKSWPLAPVTNGFGEDEHSALRSLYYARNRQSDMVVRVPAPSHQHPTILLCERAKMPPIWWDTPRGSPSEFLAARMLAGARLEGYGADFGQQSYEEVVAEAAVEAQDLAAAERLLESQATDPQAVDVPEEAEKLDSRGRTKIQRAIAQVQAQRKANDLVTEFAARVADATSDDDLSSLGAVFERRMRELDRDANIRDFDEERDRLLAAADEQVMRSYRERIREQADAHGGWLDIAVPAGDDDEGATAEVLKVPKNPFLLWCLRGHNFEAHGQIEPEWVNICPSGLKMMMDDANHTDWMVGAGLSLDEAYSVNDASRANRISRASFRVRSELTGEWTQSEFVILSRGMQDRIFGNVFLAKPHEAAPPGSIAVVPHAGPEYQLAMESACKMDKNGRRGALVCDTGGKLAHLAVVGREQHCTVVMVENATKRFRDDMLVTLDIKNGKLSWYHS